MSKDFSKQFYNSSEWKTIRNFVLQRDFYMCTICGAPHAKTVHHIKELTPLNIGDPAIAMNPNNLITVCMQCHDEIHGRNKRQEARYTFDEQENVLPPNNGSAAGENERARKAYTPIQMARIKAYQAQLK